MRVLIFKMQGIAYNSTRVFVDILSKSFKRLNVEVEIFDIKKQSINDLEKLKANCYDAIIDFNSKLSDLVVDDEDGKEKYFLDTINAPFYNYIVDHPVYHHKYLNHKLKNYNVICVDESHAEYIRHFYSHIKNVITAPLGAISANDIISFYNKVELDEYNITQVDTQRENSILFMGTYLNPNSYYEVINNLPKDMSEGIKNVIDIMKSDNNITFEKAIKQYIHTNNNDYKLIYENDIKKASVYNTMFFMADIYIRAYIRENVLDEFAKSGVNLVVYGEKYNESHIAKYKNVKIMPQVSYIESILKMTNYKYMLNIMPNFKAGIHDRVVNAMINKAVCISDGSTLMDKYFEKNKDYIYYNPVDTNSIKQVAELVKNGSIACKDIAQNGYRKAINLTFDNIATKIIANLSR